MEVHKLCSMNTFCKQHYTHLSLIGIFSGMLAYRPVIRYYRETLTPWIRFRTSIGLYLGNHLKLMCITGNFELSTYTELPAA